MARRRRRPRGGWCGGWCDGWRASPHRHSVPPPPARKGLTKGGVRCLTRGLAARKQEKTALECRGGRGCATTAASGRAGRKAEEEPRRAAEQGGARGQARGARRGWGGCSAWAGGSGASSGGLYPSTLVHVFLSSCYYRAYPEVLYLIFKRVNPGKTPFFAVKLRSASSPRRLPPRCNAVRLGVAVGSSRSAGAAVWPGGTPLR